MSNEEVRSLETKTLETIWDTKWWRIEAFGTLEPSIDIIEKELGPVQAGVNPLPNKFKAKSMAKRIASSWASG